jgi:hypothetical protein
MCSFVDERTIILIHMPSISTRKVTPVIETPNFPNSKLKSYVYNADTIASMTGQCRATIQRHIARSRFDPKSLASVSSYIDARKSAIAARIERKKRKAVDSQ